MKNRSSLILCGLLLGLASGAYAAERNVVLTPELTEAAARQLIELTHVAAEEADMKVCIAVVDPGGHLIALSRMDGAFPGCVDASLAKARTAALYRRDSSIMSNTVKNGVPVNELPNVIPLGGGVTLFSNGQTAGAIGISGDVEKTEQVLAEKVVAEFPL